MASDGKPKYQGLSTVYQSDEDVATYYDTWAGKYNQTLAEWRYDAPEQVALRLRSELPPQSAVLDAGCGTGLCGKALRAAGFATVDGVDVSSRSLEEAARSGAYNHLRVIDMRQRPYPLADDQYDGLVCAGVLTYLDDSLETLSEFCRIVRPGGTVVVTQRDDLFVQRDFQKVLERLSHEGRIARVRISEPCPYLPENQEFRDKIRVHYISFSVV